MGQPALDRAHRPSLGSADPTEVIGGDHVAVQQTLARRDALLDYA
jgi:hypothetical protein